MPILSQVRQVLAEAEEKQRLEIDFHENWTPQALRQVVRDHLHSAQVIIVSNREPYVHNFDANKNPVVQVPASGMVTALEPIMRACSGVWVAHGAGTADRETVDRYDQIRVPPDDPSYTLRRVWLTAEQEQGYYYGFCNEGLWPLCHLAYVRPAFRAGDWHFYTEVNEKFADVVSAESSTDSPVILIQDFHFALLPQLIRRKIPKATVALFWHIPWPNAETFGVCPWKREVLMHMLSADILGFHTRHHCRNFLDSVDRFVECQIDHEHMTVTLQGHVCRVAPYPISIEWPPRWLRRLPDVAACRAVIRERYRIGAEVTIAWVSNAGTSPRGSSNASRRWRCCWARIRGIGGESACCRSPRPRALNCRHIRRCSSRPTAKWSGSTQNLRKAIGGPSCSSTNIKSRCAFSSCTGRPISAWSTACTTA